MAVTERAAPPVTTAPPSTGGRSYDRLRHWALGTRSLTEAAV